MAGTKEPNGQVPHYKQIIAYIKEKIDINKWTVGDQIPTEVVFSSKFKVSRETVRHAISTLVAEGILERRRGSGTFIARSAPHWNYIKSFLPAEANNDHHLIEIKIISATESLSEYLNIEVDSNVYAVIRLRYIDGERKIPTMLEKSYFSEELNIDLGVINFSKRLYVSIEDQLNIRLDRFTNLIEPVMPTKYEAQHLKVEMSNPVLMLTRRSFCKNKPIILTKTIICSERIKLYIEY